MGAGAEPFWAPFSLFSPLFAGPGLLPPVEGLRGGFGLGFAVGRGRGAGAGANPLEGDCGWVVVGSSGVVVVVGGGSGVAVWAPADCAAIAAPTSPAAIAVLTRPISRGPARPATRRRSAGASAAA